VSNGFSLHLPVSINIVTPEEILIAIIPRFLSDPQLKKALLSAFLSNGAWIRTKDLRFMSSNPENGGSGC
jgi:hypothetical protein